MKKRKSSASVDGDKKGVARTIKRARRGKGVSATAFPAAETTGEAAAAAVLADSEDDGEGEKTAADAEFIDDECVPYTSAVFLCSRSSPSSGAPQAESDEDAGAIVAAPEAIESDGELEALFKPKSTRRRERDPTELRNEAADLVARMEVAAEQDTLAREAGALATAKLRLLPEVQSQLCRRDLLAQCMDHHLLHALAAWMRPAPDGALLAGTMRTALLRVCAALPLDTQHEEDKDKLKSSGLGKVIMHLKLHDDDASNRALASKLVDGWCRPIFKLSATYADGQAEVKREAAPVRATAEQRAPRLARAEEAELEGGLAEAQLRPTDRGFRHKAAVPEPARLDYEVRPISAVSAAAIAGGGKAAKDGQKTGARLADAMKKRTNRKQNFAAYKISVEGRGMVLKNPE